jgi:peptidoglycan/LPS O-acetylase OafA/YrhL
MKYRADIDGLRSVAVIPVVLFHAKVGMFDGGYVGVDIFFVISGYLITSILLGDLREDRFSILRFYERRVRRIFPALFALLLFCTMVAAVILLPEDLRSYGKSVFAATFFASNVLFWQESGYFDGPAELKPLLHTWSLAVEEQYYIFFPIYLYLMWRFARRGMAAATIAILVLSLAGSIWQVKYQPNAAFYLIPPRTWELLLGSALAMGLFPRLPGSAIHKVLPGLGIAFIAWSIFGFTRSTPFPGLNALFPCIGAALIIYSGAYGPSPVGWLLSTRLAVFVGKISYSLYLWHWPLLVFGGYYAIRDLTPVETSVLILVSFVCATLSWRYIESPFRGRGAILTRPKLFRLAGGVMTASAACGFAIYLADGLPARVGPEVLQLAGGAKDRLEGRKECIERSPFKVRHRDLCRVGVEDGREPEFVVWGDSHADALLGVLDRAATDAGRSGLFISRPGCPSLFGIGQIRGGFNEACIEFAAAVDELLADTPSIKTVILATRWAIYAMGERYGHEKGNVVLIRDHESQEQSLAENRRVFARGVARTLERLNALGKSAVVIGQVPEVGWDVPSVLARAKMYGRAVDIAPTRDAYLERQVFVREVFEDASWRNPIVFLWPHEILCPDTVCRVRNDDHALYYDNNHLSLTGTALLRDQLRAAFQ